MVFRDFPDPRGLPWGYFGNPVAALSLFRVDVPLSRFLVVNPSGARPHRVFMHFSRRMAILNPTDTGYIPEILALRLFCYCKY